MEILYNILYNFICNYTAKFDNKPNITGLIQAMNPSAYGFRQWV